LQIRLPAAAFIRKTIDVPGYHLGGIYGGRQRGIRIQPLHACEWARSEAGGYSRRIPFLTGMSISFATTSYPSLRPPGLYRPSILLRWKNTDRRLSASQRAPSMDAFKALRKSHSRLRFAGFPFPAWTHVRNLKVCESKAAHRAKSRHDKLTALTTLVLLEILRIPLVLTHMVKTTEPDVTYYCLEQSALPRSSMYRGRTLHLYLWSDYVP
jgi:hypothetical protein